MVALAIPAHANDAQGTVGGIFGFATFADKNCPTLRANWTALKFAMQGAGVTDAQHMPPDFLTASTETIHMLKSMGPDACRYVDERFGPHGQDTPDIVLVR